VYQIFLAGIKVQRDQVAKEYCWVIRKIVGQLCCCWSDSSVLEPGFQLHSLVDTHKVDCMYTQFWLAQNWICTGLSGT
jgi:hypothetical protein